LVELIAVLVILAILGAVAFPKFIDYSESARNAADNASIAGIKTALHGAYMDHRMNDAPSTDWVLTPEDIADTMATGALPSGITIDGTQLVDQSESVYDFTAETENAPAELTKVIDGDAS
jgi:MSHA pilin protein MshA